MANRTELIFCKLATKSPLFSYNLQQVIIICSFFRYWQKYLGLGFELLELKLFSSYLFRSQWFSKKVLAWQKGGGFRRKTIKGTFVFWDFYTLYCSVWRIKLLLRQGLICTMTFRLITFDVYIEIVWNWSPDQFEWSLLQSHFNLDITVHTVFHRHLIEDFWRQILAVTNVTTKTRKISRNILIKEIFKEYFGKCPKASAQGVAPSLTFHKCQLFFCWYL